MMKRELELLAPARNAEIAFAAIAHGADAVYIGAAHHGARHAAGNDIDDIKRVVEYAHMFDARVYVTLNTLVYNDEIDGVCQLVNDLYHVGVDALIVQDMALLKMDLPPIALHASTQCDIRTPQRAKFLQDAGFSQLVLARELTLDEIRAIKKETNVLLEAFVHGALCVSYSGNCQVGCAVTGRSANRGECPQMCRLSYDLIDGNGRRVIAGKHLLSLRDMNRLGQLQAMIDAGIDSFKIEGRLKDINYVKTVVSAYSDRLDEIVKLNEGLVRRSKGRVIRRFVPSLSSTFNRGYTEYFLTHRKPAGSMASLDTPKSVGVLLGKVKKISGKSLELDTRTPLNNGDGLSYYNQAGQLKGFRVNRVDGSRVLLNELPRDIKPGMPVYRNYDKRHDNMMSGETAQRVLDVDMTLRLCSKSLLVLDISLCGESKVTATATVDISGIVQQARTPQHEARAGVMSKLGDTHLSLHSFNDMLDRSLFVPISLLAGLRRKAVATLERTIICRCNRPIRNISIKNPIPDFETSQLDYTYNVANRLAAQFYQDAGVKEMEWAMECKMPQRSVRVMLTRYCLRRELGYCLKTLAGKQLPDPLKLRGAGFEMDVKFDCTNCQMSLYSKPKIPTNQ